MSDSVAIESSVTTMITPQVMAEAFWKMGSDQQADFFEALFDEVGKTQSAYSYGEMQWCYLHNELQRRKGKGLSMYLALSTFAFEFCQDNNLIRNKEYEGA